MTGNPATAALDRQTARRRDPRPMNGDYGSMVDFYGQFMPWYYNYHAIAAHLLALDADDVLELGCGSGLVPRHALQAGARWTRYTGIDLTAEMLDQASADLAPWDIVSDRVADSDDHRGFLHEQDVTWLDVAGNRDIIFSQGGPWYVATGYGVGYALVSHVLADSDITRGLQRAAARLAPRGRFLLGIQPRHETMERPLGRGMIYRQEIGTAPPGQRDGMVKTYKITGPDGELLMRQVTRYRIIPPEATAALLEQCGLRPAAARDHHGPMFAEFTCA